MSWFYHIRTPFEAWRYRRHARFALHPFLDHPADVQPMLSAQGYTSQCGQDKWVAEHLFSGLHGGVFVDIGAHDGLSFSNTWYLERELGWTGLAVEPIPRVFDLLCRNRRCRCIHACVGAREGLVPFRQITGYSEMLSGMLEAYDPRHLNRIEREIHEHGGIIQDVQARSVSLTRLLEDNGIGEIDYLSIDTEGAEYSILQTLDFERIRVRVIGVENNYRDYRIPELLLRHGFRFHSIVGDEFYTGRDVQA